MTGLETQGGNAPLFVAGVGMTQFSAHHANSTVVDLAREAIRDAIADADTTSGLVDQLVLANESDHLSRQVTLVSAVQSEVGFCERPAMRVEAGGASGAAAFRTAAALLRSGDAEAVVVCGTEKTGQDLRAGLVSEIFALSADSDLEFPMGVTFPALYAMALQVHMGLYGTTMEQVAAVAVKNLRNAGANDKAHRSADISITEVLASAPVASPYRVLDCSVLSDGAAAVLLVTEQWMRANGAEQWMRANGAEQWMRANGARSDSGREQRPLVRLVGSGAATAPARLGDRMIDGPAGVANFSAKSTAAKIAYSRAGITDPAAEIDVAEVYDSFSGAEVQAYEGLGFCAVGEGGPAAAEGRFDFGGEVVVNPSGGLLGRGAASGATGLAQICEVVTQLRGEAGTRQVGGAQLGLTDTHAGVCSMNEVHVFRRFSDLEDAA